MNHSQIEEKLKGVMSDERFFHTLGVRDAAQKLAKRWGADEEAAGLAGLLHDCARGYRIPDLLKMASDYNVALSDFELKNPALLHAPVGAALAEREYGITDPMIIRSIRYHTTACGDMDLLSKVVYLADYISSDRAFAGVEEIRRWAERDLTKALLCATRSTIGYLLYKEVGIHPHTLDFWNSLVR